MITPTTRPALGRVMTAAGDMRAGAWAGPVCVAVAAALMIVWTWATWPDVFIDFGREAYVAWRLAEGDVLYKEVASFNGPLSPYANAAWFRLFGVSLTSLAAGNIVLITMLLGLLYAIFEAISSRMSATIATLTFVGLFAFGQFAEIGNYNFVAPYSHEITHGVLLSFASIYGLLLYLRTGKLAAAALTGLALGLTFLTKAEVFLAASLAVGVGLTVASRRDRPRRLRAGLVAAAATAGFLAPIVVAFVLLSTTMPAQRAVAGVLGSWPYVFDGELRSLAYYRDVAGMDHPLESIRIGLNSAAAYLLFFGPATLLAISIGRFRQFRVEIAAVGALVGLGTLIVLARFVDLEQMVRPLPIFMALLAAGAIPSLARRSDSGMDSQQSVLRFSVVLFSLLLLAKIGLNVKVHGYGFALAMPATLVLVVALFDWIPRRISAAGGVARIFRVTTFIAWAGVVIVHLTVIGHRVSEHQYTVGQGGDRILADGRGVLVNAAVVEIAARLKPTDTFVVVPEGVMLNYLSRRRSSVPYVNFLPPELIMFGEDRMVDALRARPPDYVAVVDRPMEEYRLVFGRDYGKVMSLWIAANYHEVAAIPSTPLQKGRFGIRLLQRASDRLPR